MRHHIAPRANPGPASRQQVAQGDRWGEKLRSPGPGLTPPSPKSPAPRPHPPRATSCPDGSERGNLFLRIEETMRYRAAGTKPLPELALDAGDLHPAKRVIPLKRLP